MAIDTEYNTMGRSKRGDRELLVDSSINGPHFTPLCRELELTNV